ncbi:hypothetical protein CYMTET_21022, partial [Cymbomonas tetramitiformis]
IALLRLSNGHLIVCFNDSPAARNQLRLAESSDGGRSWQTVAELEAGHSGLNYAYPTLIQDGDSVVAVYSITRRGSLHSGYSQPPEASGIRVAVVRLASLIS